MCSSLHAEYLFHGQTDIRNLACLSLQVSSDTSRARSASSRLTASFSRRVRTLGSSAAASAVAASALAFGASGLPVASSRDSPSTPSSGHASSATSSTQGAPGPVRQGQDKQEKAQERQELVDFVIQEFKYALIVYCQLASCSMALVKCSQMCVLHFQAQSNARAQAAAGGAAVHPSRSRFSRLECCQSHKLSCTFANTNVNYRPHMQQLQLKELTMKKRYSNCSPFPRLKRKQFATSAQAPLLLFASFCMSTCSIFVCKPNVLLAAVMKEKGEQGFLRLKCASQLFDPRNTVCIRAYAHSTSTLLFHMCMCIRVLICHFLHVCLRLRTPFPINT